MMHVCLCHLQSNNSSAMIVAICRGKGPLSIFGEAVALQKMREGADPIMRIVLSTQGEPQPPIVLRLWIVSPLPSGILLTCICAPERSPFCLPLLQAPREPEDPTDHQLPEAQPGAAVPSFNRLIDLEQPPGRQLSDWPFFWPILSLSALRLIIVSCPFLCRGDCSSPLELSLSNANVVKA